MILKKSDDAVSPVIGVMLMLVITVVVAGVIAAFGTGMVGETESAPNVVLDVNILTNFDTATQDFKGLRGPDFQIRHVAGDPLDTDEIEIQIAWTDQYGTFHDSTYSAAGFAANYPHVVSSTDGAGGARNQPMYMKAQEVPALIGSVYKYGSNAHNYYFGDVVLTPGFRVTASADFLVDNSNNKGSRYMDAIFDSSGTIRTDDSVNDPGIMEYLPAGTPVEITILHIPSNTIIYEKEVIVQ